MKIKLLQWNIWLKENIDFVLKEIKRIDPDVLCLQELTRDCEFNRNIDTADYLASRLGFDYFFHEAQSWEKGPTRLQGNGIFSRWPIGEKEHYYIQQPPSPESVKNSTEEGRVYIQAKIHVENKPLTIGTTHLTFTPFFEDIAARKQQVDMLVDILKKNTKRFVFAGDLNSPPNSYAIPKLMSFLEHVGPPLEEKTWATKPHDKKGFKVDGLKYRIDYVFTTKDIKAASSSIVKTEVSDHLPIVAELEI